MTSQQGFAELGLPGVHVHPYILVTLDQNSKRFASLHGNIQGISS